MLTNDSFCVALEERRRMAIAKPMHRAVPTWREAVIAALSVVVLGAVVLGLLSLRLWLSLPHWVHFGV